MMTKRPLHLAVLLSLGSLLAGTTGAGWLLGHARGKVSAADERPAVVTPAVVAFGYVDVENGVTPLYPLVPGRVATVTVHANQPVKAGQVLFRLDDSVARLRVREAEADLQAARQQLAQAEKLPEQHQAKVTEQRAAIDAVRHQLEGARKLLTRQQHLVALKLGSAEEAGAAESQIQALEAQERAEQGKLRELELVDPAASVRAARAAVAAKEARVEEARRGVEECSVRAPQDGTVLRVLVSPGTVLGTQAKEPAVLFCPDTPRVVRAEVEQEFAGRVKLGQAATVHDDTHAGPVWHGRVSQIADWYSHRRPSVQDPLQFNDVRTLECLIMLDPGQPPLRIGQRVRVSLGHSAPSAHHAD